MQKSEVNERIFRCLDNPSIHPIHFSQIGSWIRCQMSDRMSDWNSCSEYSICLVFLALPHKLYLCICEFVFVYLCICVFDSWEYQFLRPWTLGF